MKKVIFLTICCVFCATAIYVSIVKFKAVEISPVATSTPVTGIQRVENKKFATTTPYAEVDIEYPKFVGDYFSVQVIDRVNQDIEDYAFEGLDDFLTQAERDVSALREDFPDYKNTYQTSLTYEVLPVREDLVQIAFVHYLDTGGAHGLGVTSIYRVRRDSGMMLRDEDIIRDQAGLKRDIHSLVKEQVIKEKMSRLNMDRKQAEDSWNSFTKDNIIQRTSWSGFVITNEGLEFYFPPYTLGAYVEGEYIVKVPWKQLQRYLTPEYIQ